ncbi:hypothetical protein FOL47_003303 [Perkinsus chesapeaki]|uniref:Uncharacterized protein n=1 Tax=Perkinsus chesapeaki TaxID=330153 RepID=A0A7J6MZU6_PERCH|nr:hypothetical protein FOL47_003303 [Perkinsus chesapeaki]
MFGRDHKGSSSARIGRVSAASVTSIDMDSGCSSDWVLASSRSKGRKEKKLEKAVIKGWKISSSKERTVFEGYLAATELKKLRIPIDRLYERAVPSAASSSSATSPVSRVFDRYITGPDGRWLEEVAKTARLDSIKYCDYGYDDRFIVLLASTAESLKDARLCLEAHASYFDVHNQMIELGQQRQQQQQHRLLPPEAPAAAAAHFDHTG